MQHSKNVTPGFDAVAEKTIGSRLDPCERETLILRLRNSQSSRDRTQAEWHGDVQHIKNGQPVEHSSFLQTDGLIRHVVNKIKCMVGDVTTNTSNEIDKSISIKGGQK